MRKRLAFILILAALLLAGCGQQKDGQQDSSRMQQEDAVTLQWYINYSWFNAKWGENLVSRSITEKTGVDVDFVVPSGDESEMLGSLISADSLPDILTIGWWQDEVRTMIQRDMVYPLDELAKEYDACFMQVADPNVLKWYTSADGHIYEYPNSAYTINDYAQNNAIASNETFLVRKDIYEAIGSPDMTTPEGFHNAVVKAAQMFPEVNGEELLPVGAHVFTREGCDSFDTYLFNFLAVPYLDEQGNAYDRYMDESFLTWLRMFRQLHEEGYLKDDIFLDNRTQMEEKIANGRYFCMLYQRTDMADQQKILYARNPEQIYIAVDGPKNLAGDDYQLPGAGINGWTVTLISRECKNPEKAIKLISYLLSDEGQLMTWYGVEGITWEYDEEGRPQMYPEVEHLLNTDRVVYDRIYGADSCYWMLQDNERADEWGRVLAEPLGQLQEWSFPYTVYTAQYDVVFDAQTQENQIYTRIKNLWGETLPRLLLAESDEEFDRIIEEFRVNREKLEFDRLQQASTAQIHDNMKRLGLE